MRYIIIGNSAAGVAAAKEIRSHDPAGDITMISKDGTFYSRCQLHYVASGYKNSNGIRFVSSDWARDQDIDLKLGEVVKSVVPPRNKVVLESGEELEYDKLLIATGSDSFFPPIPGLQGKNTYGFRHMEDALNLRSASVDKEDVTIIGAGLVGVELAIELVRLGKKVTVVELSPWPLPLQLDEITGALCLELLREKGVTCLCGDKVESITRNHQGQIEQVVLGSGRKIDTDIVVCAAGVKANTEFLQETDIKTNRGIIINSLGQTTVENIYAAGDVTETDDVMLKEIMPSAIWPTAVRQGRVAGINMSGGEEYLTKNTGLKASVSIFGTHIISIGPIFKISDDWERHVYNQTDSKGRHSVRVIYTHDNQIKAAVLWGDIVNAGLYTEAIINKRDIRGDMEILDTLDAAKRDQEELSILD